MTSPVGRPNRTRRRNALAFPLFGFPVVIDLSFIIVLGFLGYTTVSRGLVYLLIWIVVAVVAVLVHELGHAFAARAAGAAPTIELSGFGGVTSFQLATRLSRLRSLGISAAGPATGLVIGGALILIGRTVGIQSGSMTAFVVSVAIYVTLGWGVLNLLPILPMDGGHILADLLPGAPQQRERLAAGVSIVISLVAAVLALIYGWLFAALLFGWFAFINIGGVRRPAPEARVAARLTPDQVQRRTQDSRAALWLIEQGRVDEARHLAETAPVGIDPAVAGVVLAYLGDVATGTEVVRQAVAEEPDNPLRQESLQRLRLLRPAGEVG
ncbi:MAG: site-2 protease family protein [Mycobacteriales bacterium]